jgi:hypothetical protein
MKLSSKHLEHPTSKKLASDIFMTFYLEMPLSQIAIFVAITISLAKVI